MRLLVFQHIDCEHPGRLRTYLAEDDVEWTTVELDRGDPIPDLEPFDALWVMGGPMDVWDVEAHPWLIAEKRAIRRWVCELRRPFLGLCLGHQLLADALGGTCGPQIPAEIGVLDIELTADGQADPIFAGMASSQPALQWHSVRVAQPPEGAVVLASSPACEVQAMRVGENAWSMQYHVELEADTVANWAAIPAYRDALAATLGPDAAAGLQADAAARMDTFAETSRQLYNNFKAAAFPPEGSAPGPVRNDLGQPVGRPVDVSRADVDRLDGAMPGVHCHLERLDVGAHGVQLYEAFAGATDDGDWTYLPYGPFAAEADFLGWLWSVEEQIDPLFFTIIDAATDRAVGVASFLRIDPRSAVIEVGHIHLSRRLQRTPAATEAMYLMMRRAFETGFRRYEWKCDDLNGPSRSAAKRLGFRYEGTFRQATHYKGRNRDTAWFAIVDSDWPALRDEFERWLHASNFDDDGNQRSRLQH